MAERKNHTLATDSEGRLTIDSIAISSDSLEECGLGFAAREDGTVRLTIPSNGTATGIVEGSYIWDKMCANLLEAEAEKNTKATA